MNFLYINYICTSKFLWSTFFGFGFWVKVWVKPRLFCCCFFSFLFCFCSWGFFQPCFLIVFKFHSMYAQPIFFLSSSACWCGTGELGSAFGNKSSPWLWALMSSWASSLFSFSLRSLASSFASLGLSLLPSGAHKGKPSPSTHREQRGPNKGRSDSGSNLAQWFFPLLLRWSCLQHWLNGHRDLPVKPSFMWNYSQEVQLSHGTCWQSTVMIIVIIITAWLWDYWLLA